MQLGELGPANVRVKRKRLGRGIGSGLGKTSGRGNRCRIIYSDSFRSPAHLLWQRILGIYPFRAVRA